ncbi:molybdenum cofactor biosynthesis protein B [Halobacteriales archaeon QS_1_68_20]|nr:MAG: molybdenum cofactor biosynthesis protein B [Halobacteriales archaeon QS_1_68_20]
MVDFQERDTKRGLREDQEAAHEGPAAEGDGAADEGAPPPGDGEAEIDEVRQQLEERPESDGGQKAHPDESAADPGDDGDHDDHGHEDHGHDHHHHEHDLDELGAAVVTVSSSRTLADDPSGDHVVEALVDAGHDVVTRELIPDDYDDVQHTVDSLVRRSDVDVVVTTGGTGVTPDDRTPEAVRPLFEKELPGFGELFRRYSYGEIGTRVVGTRATAGIIDGVPVFCFPGSTDAVQLGVEEIVVEEAPHLAGLAQRDADEE